MNLIDLIVVDIEFVFILDVMIFIVIML